MKRLGVTTMFAAALAVAGAGCQTVQTTEAGTVGVDRQQRMASMVSSEEIQQQAAKEYGQMMAQAQQKGLLNRNAQQVQRVRTVAQRLIPHTAAFRQDAPRWPWEINVVTHKDINAWAMPGGKMAIYTGLIERLNLTDDELAAIVGHEMAHALREHARERIGRQMATETGAALGTIALEILTGVRLDPQLAGTVAQAAFVLPNSRENEQEADRIGVELAARAGYDPRAALSLWEKMNKAGGAGGPEWLSTHPSHQTRTRDLQVYSEKVMPLYEQARRR
jgi:predicted Zn-dependent protease